MSTIQNSQASWTNLADQKLDSKYEKCRNITEEIYKRINITFQIKKLETGDKSDISDNSDQIDSNELSNETDLFACDKSDISSSTEAERSVAPAPAPLNNNNNEEKRAPGYKRPRKRFRKRVKKRPPNRKRSDSEGSSDEAPLSRSLLILSPDLKPKLPEKEPAKKISIVSKNLTLRELLKPTDIKVATVLLEKIKSIDKQAVKKSENIDKNALAVDRNDFAIDKSVDKNVSSVVMKTETNSQAVDGNMLVIDKNVLAINKKEKREEVAIDTEKVFSVAENEKKSTKDVNWKSCTLCNSSFRGERGLRRHISMSHIVSAKDNK